MHNIIVVGPSVYSFPIQGFVRILYSTEDIIHDAKRITDIIEMHYTDIDMVLFTGGEDVSPGFYGGKIDGMSYVNHKRDRLEQEIFDVCLKHSVKVSGICRGFQFINVMAGGKMYQHIARHPPYHNAYFAPFKSQYLVSSTHHQLVKVNNKAIPLIWTEPSIARLYFDENCRQVDDDVQEVEGAIFTNINGFGVQFHPEIMRITDPGVVAYQCIMRDFLKYDFEKFVTLYKDKIGGSKCRRMSS